MNQENGQIGSQPPATEDVRLRDRVRGRAKAAGETASEAARVGSERAAEWARTRGNDASAWARARSNQASDWAREQISGLQGRVEADPQRATLWAFAVGAVCGILVASLIRGSRRGDYR